MSEREGGREKERERESERESESERKGLKDYEWNFLSLLASMHL